MDARSGELGYQNPRGARGRPCTSNAARSAQPTNRERHECSVTTTETTRAEGPAQSAHRLRTESSDQWARRVRHARAAHRHRIAPTNDATKGRSPGRERTGRTGQRAPRTDERQRGRTPERAGRGGKAERPRLKALGFLRVGSSYRTSSMRPEPDSAPRAVAHARRPHERSAIARRSALVALAGEHELGVGDE